jgi:Na+-translocating ferredoxin:NAD+ oxidoreductase RnfD subunit
MNKRRCVVLTPKLYIILVLVCLALISMFDTKDMHAQFLNVCVSVLTGCLLDLLVGMIQERKQLFPDGAIVTGLIIALVLGAATPWYVCAIITLIALLSKHILKHKRKPMFNPAAFGLLVAIYLFSSMESWWGSLSMLPTWCVIFLLIGGYLVTNRVNKFPQVFAFLGTYFLLLLVMGYLNVGDAADAIRAPFVNSALFLAFFMLTDPPTSPGKYKDQVIFGAIVAIVGALIYALFGGLAYLLIGLLTANVWNFVNARKPVTAIR